MIIPSYWGRKKGEDAKRSDSVYDHPTPLDEDGTLKRLLQSLSILENKEFHLVILGVATAEDIRQDVEAKLCSLFKNTSSPVQPILFTYSQLDEIHSHLNETGHAQHIPLLQLNGYSNVRNLCTFIPHILGSETAILIDDDEIFEDKDFMHKALEHIGKTKNGDDIFGVAGFYINPDNDFFLNREITPWMTYWNKIDCMNRAFAKFIDEEPRLKITPFAFGGNLILHRNLFTQIPFDPSVPRGEDIDFLINARMFGYPIYLDNTLSIKHEPPPKSSPTWRRVREDIVRFVFEKNKLDAQEPRPRMTKVSAEDLEPYPGEYLKPDLEERIFRSNQMLASEYLTEGYPEGAVECLKNIQLAKTALESDENPFQKLCLLQDQWKDLMEYFSSESVRQDIRERIGSLSL